MGIKFRKSINLGGGVKFNINKKSIGLSAGVKGARVSINSKGRKTTSIGVPGTGVSYVSTSSLSQDKHSNNIISNVEITEELLLKRYKEYKLISNILFITGTMCFLGAFFLGALLFLLSIVFICFGILTTIVSKVLKNKII